MTDGLIRDRIQRNFISNEKDKYKDIKLQPLKGGRGQFGFRFLNQIKWAAAKFNFQYLLRIDDDYFLCSKRLLSELPLRPKQNLVWGFFHCQAGITWLDEAFMIFSEDIIQKFLGQNESSMLCHPQADQQVMLWLSNILHKTYFHDTRLHHAPPASFVARFSNISNVCDSHLGAHGAFVKTMYYLGLRANDNAKDVSTIPDFARFCTTKFDHRAFNPQWRYEPKPCKVTQHGTWEMKCGLVKKLVKECSLKLMFLKTNTSFSYHWKFEPDKPNRQRMYELMNVLPPNNLAVVDGSYFLCCWLQKVKLAQPAQINHLFQFLNLISEKLSSIV